MPPVYSRERSLTNPMGMMTGRYRFSHGSGLRYTPGVSVRVPANRGWVAKPLVTGEGDGSAIRLPPWSGCLAVAS